MAKVSGSGSRIVFGAILVLVGILLLFSQMGIFDFGDFLSVFWPLIIIVIGLWQWAIRRFRPSFWPLLLIVIGLFLLALRLHLLDGRGFGVMAGAVMIAFGIWLVMRKTRPAADRSVSSDADAVDHWVIFGGVEEANTSQRFTGGNATVVFGGAEIDLRKAALAEGDVVLNLSAIFGGIDIKVPENWQVLVDGTAILGGVEDKTGGGSSEAAAARSRLHVRAVAIFGGIEISR
jgi:predicted membrane protein